MGTRGRLVPRLLLIHWTGSPLLQMRLDFNIASGSKFPKFPKFVIAMAEVIHARGCDPGTAYYREGKVR
jgi:hypothetical protein